MALFVGLDFSFCFKNGRSLNDCWTAEKCQKPDIVDVRRRRRGPSVRGNVLDHEVCLTPGSEPPPRRRLPGLGALFSGLAAERRALPRGRSPWSSVPHTSDAFGVVETAIDLFELTSLG
jgi:hypothetical protein